MRTDVVIIGSGISALTAAALLSRKGMHVIVLEKEPRIGGALKRFKRQGMAFDVGFHYTGCLGQGDILRRMWRLCGIKDIEILPFPEDGSDRLHLHQGGTVDAYFSYERAKDELNRAFPREKKAIALYFDTVRQISRRIPFYNLDLPIAQFLREFRSSRQSVRDFLVGLTRDRALQSVLAYPALLYGVPTDNVSLDIHAMVAHGYYQGAYSVAGGGQAIVDAFAAAAGARGVTFLPSTTATAIEYDHSGVTAVRCATEQRIACRHVIFTGHPSHLISLLDEGAFRPAFRKRLLELHNTISMNILFGRLDAPPPSSEWQNHIFLPDGPDPFSGMSNDIGHRLLMLTCTERGSLSLPQDGKSVILMQPAHWQEVEMFADSSKGSRPAAYQAHKERIRTAMLAQIDRFLGKEFSAITPLTVGTPLTFRDELSAPQGCSYGAAHSLDQHTPDVRTRVPGLFLSGQSTLMTGIVGASIAGLASAGHIVGLEPLWEDVRACS